MTQEQLELCVASIASAIQNLTCMIDTSYEDSNDTNVALARRLNRIYETMVDIEKRCYDREA